MTTNSLIRSGTSRRHVTRWSPQYPGGTVYFELKANERVLVVEDNLWRKLAFLSWLSSSAKIVSRSDTAIKAIQSEHFDFVFLDRDLGTGGFGEDVAAYLAEIRFAGRVIVHSTNPFGVQLIEKMLKDAGITVETIPFGIFGIFRSKVGKS